MERQLAVGGMARADGVLGAGLKEVPLEELATAGQSGMGGVDLGPDRECRVARGIIDGCSGLRVG